MSHEAAEKEPGTADVDVAVAPQKTHMPPSPSTKKAMTNIVQPTMSQSYNSSSSFQRKLNEVRDFCLFFLFFCLSEWRSGYEWREREREFSFVLFALDLKKREAANFASSPLSLSYNND